jgi:NADP-dependent 3-hydroxy acid dehydrogenase YdfG
VIIHGSKWLWIKRTGHLLKDEVSVSFFHVSVEYGITTQDMNIHGETMKTLSGKTIWIVGATGNVGKPLVQIFHDLGAHVICSARTRSKLVTLVEPLDKTRITIHPLDASIMSEVKNAIDIFNATLGTIDVVINTTGSWNQVSISTSEEEFARLLGEDLSQHFIACSNIAFAAAKFFLKQNYGLIVNISSHAATNYNLKGNLTYGPSKEAAAGLFARLQSEIIDTKIRLTDIRSMLINTEDTRARFLDTKEKQQMAVQPEDIALWIADNINNPNVELIKEFSSKIVL